MSLIAKHCIEYNDTRAICTADENGKFFRVNNRTGFKVRKIIVNHCLKHEHGKKRCDYLMSIDGQNSDRVFFIELKGGNLLHALEQVSDTIDFLKSEFINYKLEARIIGTRDTPDIKGHPKYIQLTKKIWNTNGKIIIRTNKMHTEII